MIYCLDLYIVDEITTKVILIISSFFSHPQVCEQTFYTLNFIQIFRSALQILESDIRGLPGPESQRPTPADPVVSSLVFILL